MKIVIFYMLKYIIYVLAFRKTFLQIFDRKCRVCDATNALPARTHARNLMALCIHPYHNIIESSIYRICMANSSSMNICGCTVHGTAARNTGVSYCIYCTLDPSAYWELENHMKINMEKTVYLPFPQLNKGVSISNNYLFIDDN